MAYQVGRSNNNNKPVKTTATGNAKDTGTPVSLAPIKRIPFTDQVGTREGQDGGYGENRYGGPSSVTAGQTVESRLATDLRTTSAAGADGGDVLETVQKFGSAAMRNPLPGDDVEDVKGTPASQLRTLAPGNVPDSFGMGSARSRQASYPGVKESVPATTSSARAQPIRKPGA